MQIEMATHYDFRQDCGYSLEMLCMNVKVSLLSMRLSQIHRQCLTGDICLVPSSALLEPRSGNIINMALFEEVCQ